ncbi:MAG: RNA methyltransferase [Oligoflexia bacterium]|nr:RNA methyltransferase [Oligoflexia bacterium]
MSQPEAASQAQLPRPLRTVDDLRQRLRALGAKPCHERRILRAWLQAKPLDSGPMRSNALPGPLVAALPTLTEELGRLGRASSEHVGADASVRFLIDLADNQTIEAVLLPRDGLCVSSQVGCAVGCVFCMTGRSGLLRQLGSAEIAAQVALARSRRRVDKVVFMGMGEPSHNLKNVLDAIELLGTEGEIAHKKLVFSTVGDRRVFEELPKRKVKPALAISLHTSRAELRARLLPHAARIEPAELVELAEEYARLTHYPIQYQWTLLEGINDTDEELETIARLLRGKFAIMNFIPYNDTGSPELRRPPWERGAELVRQLHQRGVLAKLRRSAGQDIDGACGQLRARNTPSP